jgi:hypothetical protein
VQVRPRIDYLARDNQAHTPASAKNQPLTPPDDRGESDLAFFIARPSLLERVRFAFADEFAIEPDFVVVQIERDPDGWPKRSGARRRLIFSGYGEGHA